MGWLSFLIAMGLIFLATDEMFSEGQDYPKAAAWFAWAACCLIVWLGCRMEQRLDGLEETERSRRP